MIIPEDHPYRAYLEQQGVDDLSPISFFQFHHFRNNQRDYAGREYMKLITLIMQHQATKGHKLLWGFNAQKQKIAQYWKDTLEQEKQVLEQEKQMRLMTDDFETGSVPNVQTEASTSTDAVNAADGEKNLPKKKRKAEYEVEEFEAMVGQLDRRLFWRLVCSGRCVEDVLIKAARDECKVQHHIHSLILFTDDKYTQDLFTSDEWSEIMTTNWNPLPTLSSRVMSYLNSFNKNKIDDLHEAADASLPINGRYNHEEHWVYRWIRMTIDNWIGLYCQRSEPLKANQSESFWRYDVFGMTNSLLRDVPDLVVVHGEVTSEDTAQRRNRDRTLPTDGALARKKTGYRCDGLVQVQGHRSLNIGVLEAAKVFDNTGSKFLMDIRKVTRELHDMLRNRLRDLLVHTRARELILVGYVVSGPALLTLFASCPGGYIARIRPHHTEFKLADTIYQFNLNLRILKHLLITKLILTNSSAIIQEVPVCWDDDSEADTTDYNSPSTSEQGVNLPSLLSTPVKKRGARIIAD
ncbi:hypothetical protein BGZ65_011104 [Modicella reniformis]|uniref:Uncharacterized protein n=1 Tax=Modicella reniformis TaxID=1440133 RepID=A0A9P6J6V4_9FUNG|nr:hypothetical protein BGZ65_011104 [Modicella reniformis]